MPLPACTTCGRRPYDLLHYKKRMRGTHPDQKWLYRSYRDCNLVLNGRLPPPEDAADVEFFIDELNRRWGADFRYEPVALGEIE